MTDAGLHAAGCFDSSSVLLQLLLLTVTYCTVGTAIPVTIYHHFIYILLVCWCLLRELLGVSPYCCCLLLLLAAACYWPGLQACSYMLLHTVVASADTVALLLCKSGWELLDLPACCCFGCCCYMLFLLAPA